MSGPSKEIEAPLAPEAEPARTSYTHDFYSWLMEQARHLRDGRIDKLDRDNLAEEIESLGREQFNKLEGALRVLLMHLLKWDHQPERRSRSWLLSVQAQRLEIEDVLSDNPGLRPRIPEAIARAYRKARIEAAKETGLDLGAHRDSEHLIDWHPPRIYATKEPQSTGTSMPLSQKIRDLIYNAWDDGYPCLMATSGPLGPGISPKGSMIVFDDEHLAYWERTKKNVLDNLGTDPRVAVMYANFKAQRDGVLSSGFLRFFGNVELHESGPMHAAIFAKLHPREQTHVGADTGIGALIRIEKAIDVRGNPITD